MECVYDMCLEWGVYMVLEQGMYIWVLDGVYMGLERGMYIMCLEWGVWAWNGAFMGLERGVYGTEYVRCSNGACILCVS